MDAQKGLKKGIRPALGRGLGALISSTPVSIIPPSMPANVAPPPHQESDEREIRFLAIDRMRANPTQPRQHFSENETNELSESIRTLGVLQPILVRKSSTDDLYEIVAGERRFRAAQRANLTEVPVIVRDLSDRETLEVAIVENVQRQNLNPVEEGKSYQRLIDEFSLSPQQVAERVGKDRATIVNVVRILKLPQVVQDQIVEGAITLGHAKAILSVKEPSVQINLAQKVINEQLSVRALEAIVSRSVSFDAPHIKTNDAKTSTDQLDGSVPEIEERLRNAVGTKVTVKRTKAGVGAVSLHFFSDDELNRLIDLLSGSQRDLT